MADAVLERLPMNYRENKAKSVFSIYGWELLGTEEEMENTIYFGKEKM